MWKMRKIVDISKKNASTMQVEEMRIFSTEKKRKQVFHSTEKFSPVKSGEM